jgi:prepilin-type processing-associated H-X9-DG protein
MVALAGTVTGSDGNWLQFRGDRALTGRSTLKGDIRSPKILWKRSVGARETLVALRLGSGKMSKLSLPDADVTPKGSVDINRDWGISGPYLDLDGSGKTELLIPGSIADKDAREFRCCASDTGEVKWQIPMSASAVMNPVTIDVDGDGRDECIFGGDDTLYAIGASTDGKSGEVRWNMILVRKGALWPYIRNERVYVCPSDATQMRTVSGQQVRFGLSYSMNGEICRLRDNAIRRPTVTVLLIDEGGGINATHHVNPIADDGLFNIQNDFPCDVHQGGCNFAFVDGHSKWCPHNAYITLNYYP